MIKVAKPTITKNKPPFILTFFPNKYFPQAHRAKMLRHRKKPSPIQAKQPNQHSFHFLQSFEIFKQRHDKQHQTSD